MPINPVVNVEMNPARFYTMVDMIKKAEVKSKELDAFVVNVESAADELDEHCRILAKANNSLIREIRMTTRTKQKSVLDDDDDMAFAHGAGSGNFLFVAWKATRAIQDGYAALLQTAKCLRPGHLVLSKKKFDGDINSFDELQYMMYEFRLNKPTVDRYLTGLLMVDQAEFHLERIARAVVDALDHYYQKLLSRHSMEGIEVHRDPVSTDLALSIFENVDAHGEIADGKKPDEISAYSKRKAEIIAEALKTGFIQEYVQTPSSFHNFLKDNLQTLWKTSEVLMGMFSDEVDQASSLTETPSRNRRSGRTEFDYLIDSIEDLDPRGIVYKERSILLTAEERFNTKFQNETLARVTNMLGDSYSSAPDLIQYILERKAELRAYFQDENSFYVCKIGAGNAFSGSAPGALEVVPGQRPNASLDEIVGSGFAEVKEFFKTIEQASQWNDIFLATSPSRTTDKSNVLLVGPQGCGKSEILRAVGGDKGSIGVFAQGSDFLTCWAGEAQKNPKRLFEAGLKLQKESRKHVHFLIDEIDAVLNQDRNTGSNSMNLTLEFQILMDGVVHYPHLSVWGATNSPERIPMPMIRRFSKVLIVGELSQPQRIHLLKQFTSFLPIDGVSDGDWDSVAKKLDGATGDVLRKVVDHIWRSKMTGFVNSHPREAKDLVDWLNKGEKFQISTFDEKRRSQFKERLGTFTQVRADDLHSSVESHLRNFAIRHEIDTAKETYKRAHDFLDSLATDKVA